MRPIVTWILIADAARARVMAHRGPGKGLKPVPKRAFEHELRDNQSIMADREGRSFAPNGGGRRSAMARPADPARLAKQAFATTLAAMLEKDHRTGAFDRLIIVAPPRMLGDLRAALNADVSGVVYGENDKDLTHVAERDLGRHLEGVLAV